MTKEMTNKLISFNLESTGYTDENIKVFVEAIKKESAISRLNIVPEYQLVDKYNDQSLVFNNVYKREVGYNSQFVKVGVLKEDNLIVFNRPTRKLDNDFCWYEPGVYTLEPDGIYLRYTELESYRLDKATEIVNNNSSCGYKDKVTGYITDYGVAVYYDQYLK